MDNYAYRACRRNSDFGPSGVVELHAIGNTCAVDVSVLNSAASIIEIQPYEARVNPRLQRYGSSCGDSATDQSESECSGSCSHSRTSSSRTSESRESNSTNNSRNQLPYPGLPALSMGYLAQTTKPRNWCLAMIASPWFERISMIVILLNCITLGMYQPCLDEVCDSNRCRVLQAFDDFIFAFFSLEMTIKMIAMGVYGRGTYLADSWNRLDFFIVLAGALEYCLNVENMNLSAIRTIRVLRPLRAINRIPSMRILVMLLLDTLPMLGNVLLLCFFVFFIFGIVGVQLWQGILRQRCYLRPSDNFSYPRDLSRYYTFTQDQEYICTRSEGSGMHPCSNLPPYRFGNLICNKSAETGSYNEPTNTSCVNWHQYYTECMPNGDNPFQGTISFDNIGLAWVAIFLVISLEGWTDIMYYVQDAHSFWDWIYFVLLIVIGSFFMINLCLVVIATQFSETKKREMERMRLERARFQSTSTLASSTNNSSEPTTCYAEIVKYIAHLYRRNKRKLFKKIKLFQYRREQRKQEKLYDALNEGQINVSYGHVGKEKTVGESFRLGRTHITRSKDCDYRNSYLFRHHPHCPRNQNHQQSCQNLNIPEKKSSFSQITTMEYKINNEIHNSKPAAVATSTTTENTTFLEQLTQQSVNETRQNCLLRVPSICTTDLSSDVQSTNNSIRQRSLVMFNDMVHGKRTAADAICVDVSDRSTYSSEKNTQAGDGTVYKTASNSFSPNLTYEVDSELLPSEAMTCQELLAFSGALSAALPTGKSALESFVNTITKSFMKPSPGKLAGISTDEQKTFLQKSATREEFDMSCCEHMYSRRKRSSPIATKPSYPLLRAIVQFFRRIFRYYNFLKKYIKILVDHRYFQQGILLAILVNTLSMGIEYHNQPEFLTHIVETSNIVFSAIFAVEMLLKVIAEGPFGYIANGFNVFDGIIVVLSGVELCQQFSGGRESSSGLSVLRTFRLLRILKLVRFMPNLRRQLFVMLRTMDNVAVFFSLLILFIFIFSILGMNLFGCKFCDHEAQARANNFSLAVYDVDGECDRKNFDTLLWALVTVFQILTQEDWNIVLSNGMAKTSHWAALYFVALMTFGNYVLFNLLVAILVEGFSSERHERREREQRELAKSKLSQQYGVNIEDLDHLSDLVGSKSPSEESDSCSVERKMRWSSTEEFEKLERKNRQNYESCQLAHQHHHHRHRKNHSHRHYRRECSHDLKFNIQKEMKLYRQSSIHQNNESKITLGQPPIIIHTAATPQDSPNNTLDHINYSEFSYPLNQLPSLESIHDFKPSSSSIPDLLKPPTYYRTSTPTVEIHQDADLNLNSSACSEEKFNYLKNDVMQLNEVTNEKITAFEGQHERESGERPKEPILKRAYSWKLRRSIKTPTNKYRGSDSDTAIVLNNDCYSLDSKRILSDNTLTDRRLESNGVLLCIKNDTQSCAGKKDVEKSNKNEFKNTARELKITQDNKWQQSQLLSITSKLTEEKEPSDSVRDIKNNILQMENIQRTNQVTKKAKLTVVEFDEIVSSKVDESEATQQRSKLKQIIHCLEPKGILKEKEDWALYLFPRESRLRQWCTWLVTRQWFDNVVLMFIALNCITLAMERPNIPPNSPERLFLSTANYVFTVIFSMEMFVKVIDTGMFYGENAYFTSGWNIMDGLLVTISIVDLLMSLISHSSPRIFGILRVFRLLRSLRPLRVINRAPGLKLVVQTLLSSLRPIGNIVLICCTFFIIFGILGVQLFKGTFYYCKGENSRGIRNKTQCLEYDNNEWVNQKYNFDDLGKALMSLFVLSSKDGWVNIMYTGLDAVGVDQQPIVNYSEWRLLYFISFILLVGFFVLNMFVGVVVENFHRCREEQEKEERILRAAKRALQLEKRRRRMNEPPYFTNYCKQRLFIHNLVTSKYFDLAIAAVIGLNVVTMAMECYLMPISLEYALKIFNYFFTAVFILESIMKLVALGIWLYLKDKWNQLDVFIVTLSVVGIVLEELRSNIIPINPTVLRVMRVLRIARVLKLLKMAKGIRALLDTVMQALPQVGNLGLLFFLLFFIFAALGVELFGRLECSDENPCQGLGEHAHFSNFGMAFLTLFRVATGDNWNGIMKDTLREDCDDSSDCVRNCCVSSVIAPLFFVVFVLMAQFVLVNVVVAVLMKHLEESHKNVEDDMEIDNQLEREMQEREIIKDEENEDMLTSIMKPLEMKTLTKVLSLPSNFIYRPPEYSADVHTIYNMKKRRQTFHSQRALLPDIYLMRYDNNDAEVSEETEHFNTSARRTSMPAKPTKALNSSSIKKTFVERSNNDSSIETKVGIATTPSHLPLINETRRKFLKKQKRSICTEDDDPAIYLLPQTYQTKKHLSDCALINNYDDSPFNSPIQNDTIIPNVLSPPQMDVNIMRIQEKNESKMISEGMQCKVENQKTMPSSLSVSNGYDIALGSSFNDIQQIITERRALDGCLGDISNVNIFESPKRVLRGIENDTFDNNDQINVDTYRSDSFASSDANLTLTDTLNFKLIDSEDLSDDEVC